MNNLNLNSFFFILQGGTFFDTKNSNYTVCFDCWMSGSILNNIKKRE
jgi:hypothetical protein